LPVIVIPDDHPMATPLLKGARDAGVPRHAIMASTSDGQRYRLESVFAQPNPKPRTIRDAARSLNPQRAANKRRKKARGY
jgi:hypothetical protein